MVAQQYRQSQGCASSCLVAGSEGKSKSEIARRPAVDRRRLDFPPEEESLRPEPHFIIPGSSHYIVHRTGPRQELPDTLTVSYSRGGGDRFVF